MSAAGLETARAAKVAQAARARTLRCPSCHGEVVVYLPAAEVFHRCPQRPASKRDLTRYEPVIP